MTSESGHSPARASWTLLLGPGPALGECLPLLETLATRRTDSPSPGIEQLESWPALFCEFPEVGRIVVDTSTIPWKHVGLLEAFLERHPGWELWLCGAEAEARSARELLRLSCARWIPAPFDVPSLGAALCPPASVARPGAARRAAAPVESSVRPIPAPAQDPGSASDGDERNGHEAELIARVEEILSGKSSPAGPTALAAPPRRLRTTTARPQLEVPTRTDAEPAAPPREDFERPAPARAPSETEAEKLAEAAQPAAPAPYFQHQVADLADLVQCVDLSLEVVGEDPGQAGGTLALRLEELRGEVARLTQFTRTLAYLAAPPARGTQRIDLAPLLAEMLGARRAEPEAPRYLIRTPDSLVVRSDKVLLSQALDALLFLCHCCAGPEGSVRVDGKRTPEAHSGTSTQAEVRISIRFPAGRLADLRPAEILEPYALRRRLPELGANALAAAGGILSGQGGRLELRAESGGGLEWVLHLPAAE
jgi:hypothetical protein